MNYKSYGFWTALAGAITLLASAIGKCFGVSVNGQVITDVVMAIAGVLVVFGVVSMPKKEKDDEEKQKKGDTKASEKEEFETLEEKQETDIEQSNSDANTEK